MSVHTTNSAGKKLLVMKGAPEKILERCATVLIEDEEVQVIYSSAFLMNKMTNL
jgi:magnesium-transporting ATPase (P-type)